MVSKTRITRISEHIREELSKILLLESNDPRIKSVTVTDTEVDRDLSYADVYVCSLEGIQRSQEILTVLEHAQGFLRSELARRMDLRVFPRLRFHWDSTFEHADQIENLIKTIHQQNSKQISRSNKKRVVNNGSSTS